MSMEHTFATATSNAPRPDKKYFTVEEANRAISYVSRIVDDVTRVYDRILELRRQIEAHPRDGSIEDLEARYESSMDRLSTLVDELHAVGAELKDFERGLVDFPAVHESREVLLCWQAGEDHVSHWHEIDAGFAGRQPVEELTG